MSWCFWSYLTLEGAVFKASILKLRWMLVQCAHFFLIPLWPYLGSYIRLMSTVEAADPYYADVSGDAPFMLYVSDKM